MKSTPNFFKENNIVHLNDLDLTKFINLDTPEIQRNNVIVERIMMEYQKDLNPVIKNENQFLNNIVFGAIPNFFKYYMLFVTSFIFSCLFISFYFLDQDSFLFNEIAKILGVLPFIALFNMPILTMYLSKRFKKSEKYLLKNMTDDTDETKFKLLSLVSVFMSSRFCGYDNEKKIEFLTSIVKAWCFNENEEAEILVFKLVVDCYKGYVNESQTGFISSDNFIDSFIKISNIDELARDVISNRNIAKPVFNNDVKNNGELADSIFSNLQSISQEQKDLFTQDFLKTRKIKDPYLFSLKYKNTSNMINSIVAFAIILSSTQVKEVFNDLTIKKHFKELIDVYYSDVFTKKDMVNIFIEDFLKKYNDRVKSNKEKLHLMSSEKLQSVVSEVKKNMFFN